MHKPKRCFKCQKIGHIANVCLKENHTCGKCGDEHQTLNCTSDRKFCVNCKSNTHTSTDQLCPKYSALLESMNRHTHKQD